MGGPWTYEDEHDLSMRGPDKHFYDELVANLCDLMGAIDRAHELAGDRDVSIGGGKRLFDGFEKDLDLEVLQVVSSELATHVRYGVRR